MRQTAILSTDRRYRYELWRIWDEDLGFVMFIGLNPSTADQQTNDPTIRKCMGFARRWNLGGICMTNLFAYRSTDPLMMKLYATDPVGPDNLTTLQRCAALPKCRIIIAGWGNHGDFKGQDKLVKSLISPLMCLRKTKNGHPWHPLYIPYSCPLIPL